MGLGHRVIVAWGEIHSNIPSFVYYLATHNSDIDQRLQPQTVYLWRTSQGLAFGEARCDNLSAATK